MSLTVFFDRTLSYERNQSKQDATGGKAPVQVQTLATGIPACIAPAKESTILLYHRRGSIVDYNVMTDSDLNSLITGGPQVNDRFNDNGTIYLILGVQRMSNPLIYPKPIYRLDCQLKTPVA